MTERVRRNKDHGSQTLFLNGQSNRELSATGRRADLYSGFGVQRNLGIYTLTNLNRVSLPEVVEEDS